jgi:hypothetical protein
MSNIEDYIRKRLENDHLFRAALDACEDVEIRKQIEQYANSFTNKFIEGLKSIEKELAKPSVRDELVQKLRKKRDG